MSHPKISVAVPIHDMENGKYFLDRLKASLEAQTFRDFELVITKDGKMAPNTNAAIRASTGDIIKILYMDDYLVSPDALQHIADKFNGGWLATGCTHTTNGIDFFSDHLPWYNDQMLLGVNTIGSPSVVAFENNEPLFFDENMSWLLDCEYYDRLYQRYGSPTIINSIDVGMGIGTHQVTNIMTDEEKEMERMYIVNKYIR